MSVTNSTYIGALNHPEGWWNVHREALYHTDPRLFRGSALLQHPYNHPHSIHGSVKTGCYEHTGSYLPYHSCEPIGIKCNQELAPGWVLGKKYKKCDLVAVCSPTGDTYIAQSLIDDNSEYPLTGVTMTPPTWKLTNLKTIIDGLKAGCTATVPVNTPPRILNVQAIGG